MNESRDISRRLIALLLLLINVVTVPQAQTESQNQEQAKHAEIKARPKVALVLSGGGARGIAHIGVLQWMHENRIPVDCIIGTSMGGLIGGLYAMGYSPSEIRLMVSSIEWDKLLRIGPDYRDLSFRRKTDRREYQVGLELGLRNGIGLPMGLSTDHYIGLLFNRLTLPYYSINNFDELPTPLRAIATDFIKAKTVSIKEGSLATAMLATMAVPGVFPPVFHDGKYLVDGGLLNNIPTDIAAEFKPGIIIAVDTATKLRDIDKISSLPAVVSQSMDIMTEDRGNLKLADIAIVPELNEHSRSDFSNFPELIKNGYNAADANRQKLESLALNENQWAQYLALRREKRKTAIPEIHNLDIRRVTSEERVELHKRLKQFANGKIDQQKLDNALTQIIGEGQYESMHYWVSPEEQNTLIINANKKRHAPPTLNFNVESEGSDVGEFKFTTGTRFTIYNPFLNGSELRVDLKLGSRNIFDAEYFQQITRKGFFIAPSAQYLLDRQDLFFDDSKQENDRVAQYQLEKTTIGLDLGWLNRSNELRFGVDVGRMRGKVRIGNAGELPRYDGNVGAVHFRWIYDGQNNASIPTKGLRLKTESRWFFDNPNAASHFFESEAKISSFNPITKNGTMLFNVAGGTSHGEVDVGLQHFTMGGSFRLSAYNYHEFRGNRYLLATTGYMHRIGQLPQFAGGKIYAATWIDFGGAFGGIIDLNNEKRKLRAQLSTGLIIDTIFGPLSVAGSYGQDRRGKFYFTLGKFF